MSAIIKYSTALAPEASEGDNVSMTIEAIAATVASAARIAETIVDIGSVECGELAHAAAELLHLQSDLLGALAVRVRAPIAEGSRTDWVASAQQHSAGA